MARSDTKHPDPPGIEDILLSAIWSRLEELEYLATKANAVNNAAQIVTLAGELRTLARALELVQPAKPPL